MFFVWNDNTIRWFFAASAHTGFHRKLAGLLRARLTPGGTLADFGCGLGLIDLELSGYAGHITCVDQAPEPLAALRAEARRRGIGNLEILRADSRALTGAWDEGLMTFHGSGEALLSRFLPHCRTRLVAVIRAGGDSPFGPARWREPHRNLLDETIDALERRGACYTVERYELEYGQPLQSLADAADFVRASCRPDIPERELESYLDAHLELQNSPEWPYYLPNRKQFAIFTLPRGENESLITSERGLGHGSCQVQQK